MKQCFNSNLLPLEVAWALAKQLQVDCEDGWAYNVWNLDNVYGYIQVFDEHGEFIANL